MNLHTIDKAALLVLQEFPCLPVHYIAALLGQKPKVYQLKDGKTETRYEYLRHRLIELRKGGYVQVRKALRPRKGQKNRYDVYMLTATGRAAIPELRHASRVSSNAYHDLGSFLIPASMKLGTMADDRLRFFPPNEVLDDARCPPETRDSDSPYSIPVHYWYRDKFINDASRGYPTHKKHDFRPVVIGYTTAEGRVIKLRFNIEYDRDSEGDRSSDASHASIERHLRMTLALLDDGFYKRQFGSAKFYVLIISTTPQRKELWKATLRDITRGKGHDRILFGVLSCWDETEEYPPATGWALERTYERVGHGMFDILDTIGVKEKATA